MSIAKKIIVVLLGLSLSAFPVYAQGTPDGQTPAQEKVCSGLSGAAFGLCNAYCEAQDCDVHRRPSCEILRSNFEKVTGAAHFPCDTVIEPACAIVGSDITGPICGGTCDLGGVCVYNGTDCFCSHDN